MEKTRLNLESRLASLLRPPFITPARTRIAYGVGIATDVLQFVLGPFGWAGADEVLDVIAAALTWRVLGFHPLLLPTFAIEFIPGLDMLPTWTGCIAVVIALRRREQRISGPPHDGPVIDV
ncbi:MAG TPA: hypothetical protein VKH42_02375 [Vicinamibacterales bacterium]|nr:hypothetical protein [Vicinamibacterales bacterium]